MNSRAKKGRGYDCQNCERDVTAVPSPRLSAGGPVHFRGTGRPQVPPRGDQPRKDFFQSQERSRPFQMRIGEVTGGLTLDK